jgi:hypothetical protein
MKVTTTFYFHQWEDFEKENAFKFGFRLNSTDITSSDIAQWKIQIKKVCYLNGASRCFAYDTLMRTGKRTEYS